MNEKLKEEQIIGQRLTPCPRCGKKARITKTPTHLITDCKFCGFNMGNPREPKK